MAVLDSIVADYTALATNYPNARAKIWASMAITAAERTNVFTKLEGAEGSTKPVWRKDDLKKGSGDKIVFTTIARLGAQPRIGSQVLTGAEEQPKVGTFELQIDIKRHATGQNKKLKLLTAVQLEGYFAAMLGDHAGWGQECDMMMSLRKMAGNYNITYGGSRGSILALKSSDVLNPSLISTAGELGATNQAKKVVMTQGNQGLWNIPRYLVVAPHPALTELKQSSQYQSALAHAAERGENNPYFTGDILDWDGHGILPHVTEDDDSNGPIGSAFAPKALLGAAIAAGTTAVVIQGGATAAGAAAANPGSNGTGPAYFQFFENYDWQWVEGQTANPDTTDRFVIIYNLIDSNNGAAGDAGKFGFYRYSTNNGYTLTTAAYSATAGRKGGRLGATVNGGGGDTRDTTVGYVAYNAGLNTEAHPLGSLVIQSNAYGVPYARASLLGAGAAMRGYGEGGIQRIKQDQDYGMKQTAGYEMVYGQTPFMDTNNQPKRFVNMIYAMQYAGVNLPVVS